MGWVSHGQSLDPETSSYYLYTVFKIALVTTLAVALIDTPKKLWILLVVAVVTQGYNAMQINLQYFEDGFSAYSRSGWASGTKGDNNGYTIFTIPVLAMSISIALTNLGPKLRLFSLAIAALQIHQILLLESRGGMLAVCLLFALVAFFAEKTRSNIIGIVAIGVVAIVLAGPPVVREFSSIFAEAGERDNSANSRFKLWKAGAQITIENPIVGVGPWCGELLVPDYYEGPIVSTSQRKALHNILFEISTGFGIPATLAYFAFFWIPLRSSLGLVLRRREEDPWLNAASLAICVGMPAFFLASMFSSGAMLETGYLLAVLGYAVKNILHQPADSPQLSESCAEERQVYHAAS
ncbi:O-antigen ligase family protein [Rubripirellula obstinata]|nr:O-antigen ligase family protein [Rubripirellula obstinata]